MYQHLASLVSYPDAGLFRALDHCIQALAPEVPEAATLLEGFRDAAQVLGPGALSRSIVSGFVAAALVWRDRQDCRLVAQRKPRAVHRVRHQLHSSRLPGTLAAERGPVHVSVPWRSVL
jgi:hypothetical protein